MDDVPHADILYKYLFHYAAPAPGGLEAKTYVRTDKAAIADKDVPGAAGHFAADDKSAMGTVYDIITDNDVLRGFTPLSPLLVTSGFYTDAIVPGIKSAVLHQYIPAGLQVDPVPIGGIPGIADMDIPQGEILAKQGMETPGRRVLKAGAFQ